MATRRSATGAALSADVTNLLLLGWAGAFEIASLEIFDLSERQIRTAWRTHEATVRAEAARRGLTSIWAEDTYDLHPAPWLREDGAADGQ